MRKEDILDHERMNRLVYFPASYVNRARPRLDYLAVFPFQRDPVTKQRIECLVWSRYAETEDEVHAVGLHNLNEKRKREPTTQAVYDGFISTLAGSIRQISYQGYGFYLDHDPKEGDHHVIIGFVTPIGEDIDKHKQHKLLKTHLKELLLKVFSGLVAHVVT